MSQTEAKLYIVATPIGNLSDMSPRAIETLQQVDLIAAEDTRHSGRLLQHFGISTPTISLYEHNEQQRSETLLAKLQQGQTIALISDAGTPLISDPGFRLVSLIKSHQIDVVPVPGSCALITALSASGLTSDKFSFEGFLPAKPSLREQTLQSLQQETRTLIFYESPKRLLACLKQMQIVFGLDRKVCLARELTKLHETIVTKPLEELIVWVEQDDNQQRGECVLIVEGNKQPQSQQQLQTEQILKLLLTELPVKKAAAMTAKLTDISKNDAYDMALSLQQK